MIIDIWQMHGALKGEHWTFYLYVSSSRPVLWLDEWSFETRKSTRHRKWDRQGVWHRLDRRSNTVDRVTVPTEIVERAKAEIVKRIGETPVSY